MLLKNVMGWNSACLFADMPRLGHKDIARIMTHLCTPISNMSQRCKYVLAISTPAGPEFQGFVLEGCHGINNQVTTN